MYMSYMYVQPHFGLNTVVVFDGYERLKAVSTQAFSLDNATNK